MITTKMYERTPERDWLGKKVRSLQEFKNGWFTAPAGTVFVIDQKQAGFGLVLAEPCPCCGLRGSIGKVNPNYLEIVT